MTDEERIEITDKIDTSWINYTSAASVYTYECIQVFAELMDMVGRDKININDDTCLRVRRRKKKSSYVYEIKQPGEPIQRVDEMSPETLIHIVCSARDIIYLNSNDTDE